MKKILLIIAAIVLFATQGNAQKINTGIKPGINLANFRGSGSDNFDIFVGANLDYMFEYMFNDRFSIQPEISVSELGAKIKGDVSIFDIEKGSIDEVRIKMVYSNIPVMFKYYVFPNFAIEVGPQVGFLFDMNTVIDLKKGAFEEADDVSIVVKDKDGVKKVDYGVNFGLEYKFLDDFSVNARYNLGLADINKEGSSLKHSVFQFSLGYWF